MEKPFSFGQGVVIAGVGGLIIGSIISAPWNIILGGAWGLFVATLLTRHWDE